MPILVHTVMETWCGKIIIAKIFILGLQWYHAERPSKIAGNLDNGKKRIANSNFCSLKIISDLECNPLCYNDVPTAVQAFPR